MGNAATVAPPVRGRGELSSRRPPHRISSSSSSSSSVTPPSLLRHALCRRARTRRLDASQVQEIPSHLAQKSEEGRIAPTDFIRHPILLFRSFFSLKNFRFLFHNIHVAVHLGYLVFPNFRDRFHVNDAARK